MERKIIELLLLYGHVEENFEDLILEASEDGTIAFKPEKVKSRVFEKVYLDLQEDEIEFANDSFKELYFDIINILNQQQEIKMETFVNQLSPNSAEAVTHILMDDEKYQLASWDSKEIYVKLKEYSIPQMVMETILNLRRHFVTMKIAELADAISEKEENERQNILQDVQDYNTLRMVLSEKLRRVV